jgi:hypothetical protein
MRAALFRPQPTDGRAVGFLRAMTHRRYRRTAVAAALALFASLRFFHRGGEVPAAADDIVPGMDYRVAESMLQAHGGEEVFSQGVAVGLDEDGNCEVHYFGWIHAGWRMNDRVVVLLASDSGGSVRNIWIFDERLRRRGKDPFAASKREVSSLGFSAGRLARIGGLELER